MFIEVRDSIEPLCRILNRVDRSSGCGWSEKKTLKGDIVFIVNRFRAEDCGFGTGSKVYEPPCFMLGVVLREVSESIKIAGDRVECLST